MSRLSYDQKIAAPYLGLIVLAAALTFILPQDQLVPALLALLAVALVILLVQSNPRWSALRTLSAAMQNMADGQAVPLRQAKSDDEIHTITSAYNSVLTGVNLQIAALQSEHARLSGVLTGISDGLILVDADGLVTLVNPAAQQLFGLPSFGSERRPLIEVVQHYRLYDMWRAAVRQGQLQSETIRLSLSKENIQATVTLLGPQLPGESVILIQDLSVLRKLETIRRDFVSNISHELRTPLASLKSLTETLQDGAIDDPAVSGRFLGQMNEEIDNLIQLVDELLELAKIESGRVPLEKRPVDAASLVNGPAERMRFQAQRANITLVSALEPGLPSLVVDSPRVRQVLINLIHNAIKFTPPGGSITVGARHDPNGVLFSVHDTGSGISEEDLPRIFERFYKSDRSRSGAGTGLGLSICKHIVEAHGGRIWAESASNAGTTLYFVLPLAN